MATENKSAPKSAPVGTVIAPPKKVFRWQDSDTISGKLTAPIIQSKEKYGERCRIALDSATVLLPARYSVPYANVPVGSQVTIAKAGAGRDTEYTLTFV